MYNDNSSVVFTDGMVLNEKLNFSIPIVSSKVELLQDGTMNFVVVNSIMVKSIESGVVEEVASSTDGVKYIKIRHNYNYVSVIANLDIVGVNMGEIVTKGKDIATAKLGEIVSLRIYVNGIQTSNIDISGSKIICQNWR